MPGQQTFFDFLILFAAGITRMAKHQMMLANHFITLIAKIIKIVLINFNNEAGKIKLNNRQ